MGVSLSQNANLRASYSCILIHVKQKAEKRRHACNNLPICAGMYLCHNAVRPVYMDAYLQGRFSFYLTSQGEEATIVGSAAALDPKDEVRPR